MAKVIGLGGIFFKAKDPEKLKEWYNTHLNMNCDQYGATLSPKLIPEKGFNV